MSLGCHIIFALHFGKDTHVPGQHFMSSQTDITTPPACFTSKLLHAQDQLHYKRATVFCCFGSDKKAILNLIIPDVARCFSPFVRIVKPPLELVTCSHVFSS